MEPKSIPMRTISFDIIKFIMPSRFLHLLSKGISAFNKRPQLFWRNLRGFYLFYLNHFLCRLFLVPNKGFFIGSNVRIQNVFGLSAELPDAQITVGDHSIIYENAKIEAYALGKINIGEKCILGDIRIYSRSHIQIGKRVISSWNVLIQDYDPHPANGAMRALQVEQMCENFKPVFGQYVKKESPQLNFDWNFPAQDIEIGDDVWLGANTTILKGTKIGAGSVVAASAVVLSGDYPPNSLLAGNPAKVVKTL